MENACWFRTTIFEITLRIVSCGHLSQGSLQAPSLTDSVNMCQLLSLSGPRGLLSNKMVRIRETIAQGSCKDEMRRLLKVF